MTEERKQQLLGYGLLFWVSLLYFFANLQKVVVPGSVFNELQKHFACDAANITGLGAGFMYAYSLNQLTVGVLADRYSGSRVIAVGGTAFCLGSLLSAYYGSLPILLFSRVLTGFGASVVYLSMVKMIIRISGSAFTFVLGIIMLVGYSGSIVSGAPFIGLVKHFGYEKCMLTIGIATAVSYAGFILNCAMAKLPPLNKEVKLNLESFGAVLKRKHNICMYFTTGIGFAVFYSMQMTIGKKFLEDYTGISAAHAGNIMSVTMIIASCNSFLLAALTRMLNNRRLIFMHFCGFGTLTGALLLLATVVLDLGGWYLPAAAWILLSFAGNTATIQVAMQKETNYENRFGTSLSISNCTSYMIIAIVGSAVGMLLDLFPPMIVDGIKTYGRNSYIAVFLLLAILGGISAFTSLFLKETNGKNIADQL